MSEEQKEIQPNEEEKILVDPTTQEELYCSMYNDNCASCRKNVPRRHKWVPVTMYCNEHGTGDNISEP